MHLFMHQWSLIMIGIQLWRICDFFFQVHDVNEKIRKKWILVTSSHLLWSGVYVGNLVMIHLIFFPKSALWKKTGKKTGKKWTKMITSGHPCWWKVYDGDFVNCWFILSPPRGKENGKKTKKKKKSSILIGSLYWQLWDFSIYLPIFMSSLEKKTDRKRGKKTKKSSPLVTNSHHYCSEVNVGDLMIFLFV